ncbi:MAG: hypothetical protein J6X62_06995 [Bacteroidales bacterium]|nr:hypothetical protein [Bacteroidales bacterium]
MTLTPTTAKALRISAFVVKMLLGLVFALSAVTKLLAIDKFELYVYSYGFLSLNASFIVARLCIAVELLLAIGLLSNLHGRFVTLCTMLALVAFSCFLGYALLTGRSDSCHCFGDLLPFNPQQSLLKNAVLVLLTVVAMYVPSWRWRPHWALWIPVIVAPLATVFIVSSPDNWLFHTEKEPYNKASFARAIAADAPLAAQPADPARRLVAFYSPRCPYCRLAAQKLTGIQQRNDLPAQAFVTVFPLTDTAAYSAFYRDIPAQHFAQVNLQPDTFLHITYGLFPLILLLDGDSVVYTYSYRSINEHEIASFFLSDTPSALTADTI